MPTPQPRPGGLSGRHHARRPPPHRAPHRDATGPGVLFDTWRHHAFVTSRTGNPIDLDVDHRRHAVIELVIRNLKTGAGMNHFPSGDFRQRRFESF